MLVEFNCNRRSWLSGATVTNMPAGKEQSLKHWYCNRPAGLMKLLQKKKILVSDMCAGPVPHNQTCAMINMSADQMAMMAGLLVWCK